MDGDFAGKLIELSRQKVIFPKRDKNLVVRFQVDEVGTFEVEEGEVVVGGEGFH